MANDQISLDEYLAQLNQRINTAKAPEPCTSTGLFSSPNENFNYIQDSLHPTYGAVPNVNVGSGINVSSPVWTTNTTAGQYSFSGQNIQPGGKVVIQGEDADLVIGKKSMRDWMERVEERLNILTPNPEMEKEWDDLRRLGERYRKLEKKCKEKSEVWKRLKAT
jgi:hypothetical protein